MSPATDFSVALLTHLVARGLRHVVLTPGSRSQALALAAAELDRRGELTLIVRLDERSAAFTALGIARESRTPVAIVTTSGTAVGNLLPAVMEAHHSGVPIIVLSADRPAELRGSGANQTTLQPKIFASFVRLDLDVEAPTEHGMVPDAAALAAAAVSASRGTLEEGGGAFPGPVHLNLQFREPLSGPFPEPNTEAASQAVGEAAPSHPHEARARAFTVKPGPRTVVIAGDGAGPEAEELAHAGGWPLIAEASSGARFGRNLVVAYRQLLHGELAPLVQRAIVFGHPTLSREVPALLGRADVEVVVVASGGERITPGNAARRLVDRVEVGAEGLAAAREPDARAWLGRWIVASRQQLELSDPEFPAPDVEAPRSGDLTRRRDYAKAELAAARASVSRPVLALAVWRATWPHDRLVLGASRLIREADKVVPGKKITVHANRGLAGIDGTISTAVGVALASQGAGRGGITRVLLGDLTLLHDAGGLLIGDGEQRPRVQLVVGNDAGGTIFDSLEVAETADPDAFARVMRTPQSVALEQLAAAYGWSYTLAKTRQELDRVLTSPSGQLSIVEVRLTHEGY
ncbi:2-succinyl-5-enolpyruvyl-6-hydroxy-3-cyclohexene-1-carboxylic-acid synthase [Agreia sp. COWG]|uniref:2-succinyl-5-enolpyruvyl-6-hydroxy-3- cyclohexene-1-carboxylic-acid synthase n=1 Tax=Agreia sp. COWG TaxID=2773266 RepID=UPI00192707B2|nr:2-succinyl-5-enolpyruvyl-6-hydroxy-3-cyclohexene-1-carboxylic-acid synthase [Agreia sp. COWG]CAD5990743.1 2-succinyl-5-enolpyruvyl-6-hydroxy-3-cyclohexene-1-carboxylate synthase [Agreia sp. COWG]